MRRQLLEFLFGKKVIRESEELGEEIVRLFEDADEVEGIELAANKKPLADALKSMGVSCKVEPGHQCAEIRCDDDAEYRRCMRLLSDPENIHKLAQMGWVAAGGGDQAMANEKPDYKIGFIEIATVETGDSNKPDEKVKEILKQGREFASEPMDDSGDELNPVKRETGKPDVKLGGKTKGVGKPTDGKAPEGKPKGATGKVKESARQRVDRVLEMTGVGSIAPVECPMGIGGMRSPRSRKRSEKSVPHKTLPELPDDETEALKVFRRSRNLSPEGDAVRKSLGMV